ncbi:MAG: hypothetical protein OXF01_02910 [Gemmatimonadetes bacterium]|nr:hypothetical protein [Gemmatimonadota bacterium]
MRFIGLTVRNPKAARRWLLGPAIGPRVAGCLSGMISILILCVLTVSAGCTDPDARDLPPSSAKDSAGIEVIDIRGSGSEGDGVWRLTPDPLLTIGVVAGEPEYEFSYVVGAFRLAPDTIVVLDDDAGELRFYDGLGNHIRTVGGRGEGPGEFEWATDISTFAGGVQLKASNKRIRFSSSGDLISDDSFRWTPLQQYLCPLTFLGDEVFLCDFVEGGIVLDDGSQAPQYRLLHTVWGGQRFDTLGLFTGLATAFHRGNDGRLQAVSDPFERQDHVALGGSPPVVVTLRRDLYELTIMTTEGQPLRIVRRHEAEEAPGDEVIDSLYQRAASGLFEVARADVERLFPRRRAVVGGWELAVDRVGNIWVGVEKERVDTTGRRYDMYEVFRTDGSLLGSVAVPAGARLADVGEDYVLLVTRNELDVPFLALYGLVKD